jgi:hypothetical protein
MRGVLLSALLIAGASLRGLTQEAHPHTPAVSGLPHGMPLFCSAPTIAAAATGAWSNPQTWLPRRVPRENDRVSIGAGHVVTYDVVGDSSLDCVEVRGHLRFETEKNTRMKFVTLTVLDEGHLEVGSAARPVSPGARAELVVADRRIDPRLDPAHLGNGIVGFGKVTMSGAPRTPTFVRLRRESAAGDRSLELEQPVTGWNSGDAIVIPDTRQLRAGERGEKYTPQTERLLISTVSGLEVALTAPLAFNHSGARNAEGRTEILPHVGNLTRNVIVRSENPRGTRGHVMFVSRADVDVRFVAFQELGRTRMGSLDSTQFDSAGRSSAVGTNQIGRYAVHFHHTFGPAAAAADGYQFRLIGNSVDGALKWGITIHRSHYGLIQDNVVYKTKGAGIVTEDGSESFNVFDHNFAVQTAARRGSGAAGGYGASTVDVGGDGAGFWFRGPNNFVRNNVAASGEKFGFALPAASLLAVRVPAFKGADNSKGSESSVVDMSNAPVLEFANNEAYGTMESGVSTVWNGTISNLSVWHASHHGVSGSPPQTLVLDRLKVRGDPSVLNHANEAPVGVWTSNYVSKRITVARADVQGMRVGVLSPFFYSQTLENGRGAGELRIEDSYFRNHIGVSIATAYVSADGASSKTAIVRNSLFEPLALQQSGSAPVESISMNYGMTPGDARPRAPILIYDHNRQAGNNFKVYYSHRAPEASAPCHTTIEGIGGWVCR